MAAANEISCSNGSFIRTAWYFHIKRRWKNISEGFSWWKRCFCSIPDRLATGRWYRSIVTHCANKKPRTGTNPLKWDSKSDWSALNMIDRSLILIAFLLSFSLKGLPFSTDSFPGRYVEINPIYFARFDKAGYKNAPFSKFSKWLNISFRLPL